MLPSQFLDSRWLSGVETVLVLIALAAALWWPERRRVPLGAVETALKDLSSRPYASSIMVAGLAIGLRAVLLPVLGPPAPFYPDEFSLLLQGETFALGRLANATHPLFEHFETAYVAQRPSYASMYFPGRGAPLALGILLFGDPWAGAWLSMVALSVATVWMLRGWVSPPLALLGGILVVIQFGVLSGWVNSYYGGGFAALGGALLIGAYPRLMKQPRWRDGVVLGVGLLILMVTRPYEGLLVAAPFLVAGGFAAVRRLRGRDFMAVGKMALPTFVLTSVGLFLLLATNAAATGDILVDPYSHNRSTYAFAPPFLVTEAKTPTISMPEQLWLYYQSEVPWYERRESVSGIILSVVRKFLNGAQFYVGAVFFIPFVLGLLDLRRYPVLAASGLSLILGFLLVTWDWTQYLAPGFGLVLVIVMQGFARLRKWRFRERPTGLFLSRSLPCIAAVSTLVPVAALYSGVSRPAPESFTRSCCAVATQTPRTMIMEQLSNAPGRDLVLVRFRPGERTWVTLVANEAEIDKADVIWAHDLGAKNDRILNYYADRKVWLVDSVDDTSAEPFVVR